MDMTDRSVDFQEGVQPEFNGTTHEFNDEGVIKCDVLQKNGGKLPAGDAVAKKGSIAVTCSKCKAL